MVAIKYFGNKSWSDITREERYFCSELYFDIKRSPQTFIEFLNKKFKDKYNTSQHWEVGYEVCFYRDFLFSIGKSVKLKYKGKKYPQKRTFDLCLFSNTHFILIEAKADQKFDKEQLKYLLDDEKDIKNILGDDAKDLEVDCLLLNSSHKEKDIKGFDKFTWIDLYKLFNDNHVYQFADELPLRNKPKKINK